MNYDKILIRYGELGLKSKPVRRRFSDRLITNIHEGLDSRNIEHKVEKTRGRLFVKSDRIEESSEILERIFGIVSFSPVKEVETDLNVICDEIEKVSKGYLKEGDKFSIRARRSGSHNFTSQTIERKAGSKVMESNKGLEVDLDNPDKTIYVEARQRGSYIFLKKIKGPGGMPLGTQDRVLVLISDILYSPVACWLMMKRGCSVFPVFVDNRPYENLEDGKESVSKILSDWSMGEKFSLERYENGDAIFKIKENVQKDLGYIASQRVLYGVMQKIAKEENCKAIVSPDTSENTFFENLQYIDEVTKIPILRPLIGFDKNEVEDLARKIGNFDEYVSTKKNKIFSKRRTKIGREDIGDIKNSLNLDQLIKEGLENFE